MNIKESIKHFVKEQNPLVLMRRKRLRHNLKNQGFSLLCPNCIGGIIYHDLGLQFRSPTINTMMQQPEFAKFVLNMEEYLQKELEFVRIPEYRCPCALLGDVIVHFTHYHTPKNRRPSGKNGLPA